MLVKSIINQGIVHYCLSIKTLKRVTDMKVKVMSLKQLKERKSWKTHSQVSALVGRTHGLLGLMEEEELWRTWQL